MVSEIGGTQVPPRRFAAVGMTGVQVHFSIKQQGPRDLRAHGHADILLSPHRSIENTQAVQSIASKVWRTQ